MLLPASIRLQENWQFEESVSSAGPVPGIPSSLANKARGGSGRLMNRNKLQSEQRHRPTLAYVKYEDHVVFHRADTESLTPEVRECVGWLTYQSENFITISWDRCGDPSTLNGGSHTSGIVIMRNCIKEMRTLV